MGKRFRRKRGGSMKYTIDFFEIQEQTEVYRFSKIMHFSNWDCLYLWTMEYLETSNIWKNCNMLVKVETMPTIQKSNFFYHAEQ